MYHIRSYKNVYNYDYIIHECIIQYTIPKYHAPN